MGGYRKPMGTRARQKRLERWKQGYLGPENLVLGPAITLGTLSKKPWADLQNGGDGTEFSGVEKQLFPRAVASMLHQGGNHWGGPIFVLARGLVREFQPPRKEFPRRRPLCRFPGASPPGDQEISDVFAQRCFDGGGPRDNPNT